MRPPMDTNTQKIPDNAPEKYKCSLTHKVPEDPVRAPSGKIYSKFALLQWLEQEATRSRDAYVVPAQRLVDIGWIKAFDASNTITRSFGQQTGIKCMVILPYHIRANDQLKVKVQGARSDSKRMFKALAADDYLDKLDDIIPNEYICPIGQQLMSKPVVAITQTSYEYENIYNWLVGYNYFDKKAVKTIKIEPHNYEPESRIELKAKDIRLNKMLAAEIEDFKVDLAATRNAIKKTPEQAKDLFDNFLDRMHKRQQPRKDFEAVIAKLRLRISNQSDLTFWNSQVRQPESDCLPRRGAKIEITVDGQRSTYYIPRGVELIMQYIYSHTYTTPEQAWTKINKIRDSRCNAFFDNNRSIVTDSFYRAPNIKEHSLEKLSVAPEIRSLILN